MKTLILKVDPKRPALAAIKKAAEFIKKGELVAFPTETVYGLGADALNEDAVRKIFEAKGRPLDNPIIVHIYSIEQLKELARKIPKSAFILAKHFWPGPLTMILHKRACVPKAVTANLETVAIRMPSHRIARLLCKHAEKPIAAPSANLSGKPSASSAKHVLEDFKGKIACIIDGGNTNIGLESTVIDLTAKRPVILRPGGITAEQLRKFLPEVKVHAVARAEKKASIAKSPGTKNRHYAPKAKLVLVEGPKEKAVAKALELAKQQSKTKKVALLIFGSKRNVGVKGIIVKAVQKKRDIGKRLFALLRELDTKGVEIIFANGIDEKGIGLAIMNRLRRASSKRIKVS
ncbi:MAG: threonylcarbamoyl-AMP synthase [Candidatus Diapherotrites archaeon]|nr:threonylcarbamoyl-AMP synthase [Candidatus Diapherotrites archaeon]